MQIRKVLAIFILSGFCFCNNSAENQVAQQDTLKKEDSLIPIDFKLNNILDSTNAAILGISLKPTGDYNVLKIEIKQQRIIFAEKLKNADKDSKNIIIKNAGDYLFETLLNRIIPFWYGTPWCLSGLSNVPNTETVGCSYFISNTLVACGFNLNRYRLAQTDPIAGSKSLTFNDSVIHFKASDFNENAEEFFVQNFNTGIYIFGLDSHVGYMLIFKQKAFFVHSAYYTPNVVTIEYLEKSPAIKGSQNYYVTPVTTNTKLIEKWITGEFIFIKKPEFSKVSDEWWNKQSDTNKK